MKKRIAIFISGRGSNMEAIVRNAQTGILKDCCTIAIVLANKKETRGLEVARLLGIDTAVIESKGKKKAEFETEVLALLEREDIDYIVLAGFMRILSLRIVSRYRKRIINIHPADTARFKGLGAYEWAFGKGLQSTKITVHHVDEGVDTGPVIAQKEVDLTGATTLEEVQQRGLKVEHEFYSQVLKQVFTAHNGVER